MTTITHVTAHQILDSRGRPTVEASVQLSDGTVASSSVPSNSSHNDKFEAFELRDNRQGEYFGYGVTLAVQNVNQIIGPALMGKDPLYQTQIDQALVDLDGTKNKSKLGANAILAVSQAVMKSAAASLRLPLFVYVKEKYHFIDAYRIPTPIFNLINGGRHGSGTLDFQEFQLVPASHLPYPQALRIGVEMFMAIEKILEQKGAITTVGLEGGFSPNLASNADALEIFGEASKLTQYTLSQDAFLGLDLGPAFFYKGGKYTIKDRPQPMNSREYMKYLKDLHEQYRVFTFEDPIMPDDWADWKTFTAELGQTAMIVADDLVATNKTLLIKAIQEKACNAITIKPNRVGTVTEAIEILSIAKQAGWHTIMSHRSSDTTDDFLADLAVGIGADYVKFGAPSRGERVIKYNRLLRIEEILRASQPETTNVAPQESSPTDMFGSQNTLPHERQTAPLQNQSNPPSAWANQDKGETMDSSLPNDSLSTSDASAGAPAAPGMPSAAIASPMTPGASPILDVAPAASTIPGSLDGSAMPAPMSMPGGPAPMSAPLSSTPPAFSAVLPPTPSPVPGMGAASPPPVDLSIPSSAPDTTPVAPPASTPPTPGAMPAASTTPSEAPHEVVEAQSSLNELAKMVGPGMSPTPSPALAATPVASPSSDTGLPKPVPPSYSSSPFSAPPADASPTSTTPTAPTEPLPTVS